MKGKLLINGKDAFEHYGVIIEYGGYKSLVQYPSLKSVVSEEWPEEDGVDPDLASPQLSSREFDLSFIRFNSDRIAELLYVLANGVCPDDCTHPTYCTRPDECAHPNGCMYGRHNHKSNAYSDFEFVDFRLKLRLRLVSQANIQSIQNVDKFTLRFANDIPLEDYTYAEPIDIGVTQRGYELGFKSLLDNGTYEQSHKSLSDYGIYVLGGTDEEMAKSPAVKKGLLTNIDSKKGAIYNGNKVVFEQKDVAIKCLIYDTDLPTFWHNYMAFLYDLTSPYEKSFFTEKIYEEFPCYYKSSSVSEFAIVNGKVWCKFSVTLAFFSFRVGNIAYLLTAEDNALFLDEEGINSIDVKEYGSS